MARTTIATSNPNKSADADNGKLPPAKKRMAIAASIVLVCSLGVVIWYFVTSDSGYQEIPAAAPLPNTLLTITNTTNSGATVKIHAAAEATPPAGFSGEGATHPDPTQVSLEPQQSEKFTFADSASLPAAEPIVIDIEANVGGTSIKGTFTFARKKNFAIMIYDAAGTVTFDPGPGVTAK